MSIRPHERSTRAPSPLASPLPSAFCWPHTSPARTVSLHQHAPRPRSGPGRPRAADPGRRGPGRRAGRPRSDRPGAPFTVSITGIVVPLDTSRRICSGGVTTLTPRGTRRRAPASAARGRYEQPATAPADRQHMAATREDRISPLRRRGPGPRPTAPSVDDGVALLAQELRDVVHRQAGLAGGAGALPAAERLDARPGAGRRAGAPVDVQDARVDLLEEPLDLGRVLASRRPRSGRRCCRWRARAPRPASRPRRPR